jgi:type III restriction enzyme
MELKNYQRKVLDNLARYLSYYGETGSAADAYRAYLADDGLESGRGGVARYIDTLSGVPSVCVKVPTGGGKTFIAANALGLICDGLTDRPADVVVWLVPRKEILTQTLQQLRDPGNPLRMALDRDFAHRVEVLDKEDGLRGRGFSRATVEDQLTLFVLSYDSFKNKDGRRAYAENSQLMPLTDYQRSTGQAVDVSGADSTALISAIAGTNPIIVVDESHHAQSELSQEMLRNLNPRFVLELTATPRASSNVISRVTARELKSEQMVKLPVIVYRRHGKREVVQDAVLLQRKLEQIAIATEETGGDYVRPIVLLQAEANTSDEAETYQKLKQKLVDAGIPAEQVAIRTGDVDEIGSTDLMERRCPIRYIITVEALAEGWDCPFAYILATVANKNSRVSVEQIIGRILRQPYAHRSKAHSLNISYVLTSSGDFNQTIDQVIAGLNGAGFSKRDLRAGGIQSPAPQTQPKPHQGTFDELAHEGAADDASDDDLTLTFPDNNTHSGDATHETAGTESDGSIDDIIEDAEKTEEDFQNQAKEEAEQARESDTGLGDGMNQFKIREAVAASIEGLQLPQFRAQIEGGLFTDETWVPFEKHMLLANFDLTKCGTVGVTIDAAGMENARQVDVDEDDELRVRQLAQSQQDELRKLFAHYTDKTKRMTVRDGIMGLMTPQFRSTYGDRGLRDFVGRVVKGMTSEQIDSYMDNGSRYSQAVVDEINRQAKDWCRDRFRKQLNDRIVLKPSYKFPSSMIVRNPMTKYGRTLYEAESGKLDGIENDMADALSNSEKIRWWHRIDEHRKDGEFCINGFINHYPDFIAMTTDGAIIAIETKGEHLKNDDSLDKLDLGTRWALMAGHGYRYCMVFAHDAINHENSYTFDEFKSGLLA